MKINIKLPTQSTTDSVLSIIAVCLVVSTVPLLSMFATTYLSALDEPEVYKIDNIRYTQNFNQLPDSGESHSLLKSELSNQTKQKIMNQKNVTVVDNGQLDVDEKTVALTTETEAYVINVENQNNTVTWVPFVSTLLIVFLLFLAMVVMAAKEHISGGGDDFITCCIRYSIILLCIISAFLPLLLLLLVLAA